VSGRAVILVVDAEANTGAELAADLRELLDGLADVELVSGAAGTLRAAHMIHGAGGIIPLAFVDLDFDAHEGADVVVALHGHPQLRPTRTVLVTSRASLHDVDKALQIGAVNGMMTRPWTTLGLGRLLEANLATYLVEFAPDRLDEFGALLDAEDLANARKRMDQQRAAPDADATVPRPLLGEPMDDDEMRRRLVELLDRGLGHPARLRMAPGTIMIEEDEDVGGIYVVLDGMVRLSSHTQSGELVMHERSTGAIVGLLSLASRRRAMLRCQAITDVRAIPVTLDQLARALAVEPELGGLLTQILISSLARRLRRSEELQVELDESLAALSEARAQLVASARFTALGEMAAGMAHELNNPTAALVRSVDHLADDVAAVVDDPAVGAAVLHQLDTPAMPSSELRARRRRIADVVGDRALADRLVDCGVTDGDEAIALAGAGEEELRRLEATMQLADTVRNITGVADRIQSLVGSLRSYVRGEDGRGDVLPDVDVTTGIDDALRLVSHRLDQVEVRRDYEHVPALPARPGAIQQVWSNLLINALDAMHDEGLLSIHVRATEVAATVEIADDGPGIRPDLQARIFEPRFTTKDGRVEFGLGLGLSISRQIVEEHNGTIDVESRPGHTVFTVVLPMEEAGRKGATA
jgi:two-component system NtrC family sensor kinase